MSHCRGCGKEVIWLKTKNGRDIPCDPAIIEAPKENNHVLILESGDVVHHPPEGTKGRISHFATCPRAGAFRKKKGGPHAENH